MVDYVVCKTVECSWRWMNVKLEIKWYGVLRKQMLV